jgi:hypothetical protein
MPKVEIKRAVHLYPSPEADRGALSATFSTRVVITLQPSGVNPQKEFFHVNVDLS